jgi:hypothetical protein
MFNRKGGGLTLLKQIIGLAKGFMQACTLGWSGASGAGSSVD